MPFLLGFQVYADLFASQDDSSDEPPPGLQPPLPPGALWVPQGGACAGAEQGVRRLADEIASAWFGDSATLAAGPGELLEPPPAEGLQLPGGGAGPSAADAAAMRAAGSTTRPAAALPARAVAAAGWAAAAGQAAVAKVRQDGGDAQRLAVVLPGGTGATALFLARHLQPRGIQVVGEGKTNRTLMRARLKRDATVSCLCAASF
jgi:hypothetical protein